MKMEFIFGTVRTFQKSFRNDFFLQTRPHGFFITPADTFLSECERKVAIAVGSANLRQRSKELAAESLVKKQVLIDAR